MKNRSMHPLNIYEMWVRLQSLLDNGPLPGEEASRESLGASPAQISRSLVRRVPPPFTVTQYFLTSCVKPSPEILAMLPDDLFTSC